MNRTVALLLVACAVLSAQAPLRVAGFLVDAVTGEPVRRANVALQYVSGSQAGQALQMAMSDAGGHFEFPALGAGKYRLWAERRGYPKQEFSPATGLVITADNTDLSFRLSPYAALTGTVVDENGDTISGVGIQLIRSEIQGGRREFRPALSTVTDDRGEYRVASLVSGRYYVSAYARAQAVAEDTTYGRRFFPAAPNLLSAAALELEPGSNQRADFRLQPEPAFHIRGQVAGAGELSGLSVTLAPRTAAESFGGNGYTSRFTGEGRFEIAGVTPGQYVLTASAYKGLLVQTTTQLVAVGAADLEGVVLTPGPLPEIAGHITVDQQGSAPVLAVAQVGIRLDPTDSITRAVLTATVRDDRTFVIPQAAPGEYALRVSVPEPYYVTAASAGGLDLLSTPISVPVGPIEITLGQNGGEVNGTVKVQDKPAANCVVMLTKGTAQNKFVTTDANGRFLVRALPAGEYTAYAWRDVAQVEYRNPQALRQYSGAGVTVAEGAKQTVDLQLNGTLQ